MAEVRTLSGGECLDEFNIEEAEFGEPTHLIRDPSDELLEAPENQALHDEPALKTARDAWLWENKIRDKTSKEAPPFPEANFQKYKDLSPKEMFELFISEDILEEIAKRSNQYALTKSGMLPGIKSSEIKVFFGILLLSGYISLTNYELYWSNSLDTANTLVKSSMSRDRFKLIKRFLHLGSKGQNIIKEGQADRYGKVRLLIEHSQKKFSEHWVPEQNLSHDESMIR